MAYDYRVTQAFLDVYQDLADPEIAQVDAAVERLLDEHESAWARQGRVRGESGEAWIIELRAPNADISLYWDYLDGELILLAALIIRSA